jgi:hypothetical protein
MPPSGPPPLTAAEHDLLARARKGEQIPVGPLRALLAAHPEIWRSVGDLSQATERKLLDLLVGTSGLVRESVRLTLADLKAGLLDAKSGAAERLAVDRVAVTWLEMSLADSEAIDATRAGKAGIVTVQRRVTAAQSRHLAALKQLEVIRRLLRPVGATLKLADFVPETRDEPASTQDEVDANRTSTERAPADPAA